MHFLTQSSFSFLPTWPNQTTSNCTFLFITYTTNSLYALSLNSELVFFSLKLQGTTHPPNNSHLDLSSPASSHAPSSLAMSCFHTSCSYEHSFHRQSLPFNWSNSPLKVKMGDNCLNFFQAHLILATTTESAPPSAFKISAKYQNFPTLQSITVNDIETISLHCSILVVWRVLYASLKIVYKCCEKKIAEKLTNKQFCIYFGIDQMNFMHSVSHKY